MPTSCSAYGCTNRFSKGSGITFHRFPKENNAELRRKWIVASHLDTSQWPQNSLRYFCSHHFQDCCFREVNGRRYLHENSVPTRFKFPQHLGKRSLSKRRVLKRCMEDAGTSAQSLSSNCDNKDPVHVTLANTDHAYSFPSPNKIRKQLQEKKDEVIGLKKKIKLCQQTIRREQHKRMELKEIVSNLQKCIQSDTASHLLDHCFSDVIKELYTRKDLGKGFEYPDSVKTFALTLHFYSAKAYNFLRQHMQLPHPDTLRRWALRVGGKPGFTEESYSKIGMEVSEKGPLFLCLMLDEMSIKRQVDWDGKESIGYCNLGHGDLQNDNVPLASNVLVFMVTALNRSWKIPIGYCLVEGLSGNVKANLIHQYLTKLAETGATVVSLTCDGCASNLAMLTNLGIDLNPNSMKHWFPHPSQPNEKVYVLLDACHMLKLFRNLLAEKKVIFIHSGSSVIAAKWDHIVKLNTLQCEEGLHLANKLKRNHVEWWRQKMKVALAAQTLSRSVAKALQWCQLHGLAGFEDADGTIDFIMKIDKIFDFLNSCSLHCNGTKSAIKTWNKSLCMDLIKDAASFLKCLKDPEGKPLYASKRKVPVIGFLLDLCSVQSLSMQLVWEDQAPLNFLLTRKLSQDHLEMFFATIRSRGRDNNNPSALEFRAAYRKCLVARILPPSNGNCRPLDDTEPLVVERPIQARTQQIPDEFISLNNFDHDYVPEYEPLTTLGEHAVHYIAGYIVKRVCTYLKCPECADILCDVSSVRDAKCLISLKDAGGLIYPSNDVIKLLVTGEKVLRSYCGKIPPSGKNLLLHMQICTLRCVDHMNLFYKYPHLFTSCDFGQEPHHSKLLKEILKRYFSVRLFHMCKMFSSYKRGEAVRQIFTKLVLFKGQ